MNLLRCLLLLVVLFAVYASACHGSQTPRTRGKMEKMEMMKEPEDPLKKEFGTFKTDKWDKTKIPTYEIQKTRKMLADELDITKEQLDKYFEYAKNLPEEKDFIDVVKKVDAEEAKGK